MLQRREALERIRRCGIIAVLRGSDLDQLEANIDALLAGGIDCVEMPISYPAALTAFPRIRAHYREDLCLGSGSVFNSDLATLAAGLDGDFISAPSSDMAIVEVCKARDVASVPGAMTPTEIIRAWHVGADLIKVFPASLVGPDYFENMLTQLSGLQLVAAGGIGEDNLGSFFQAGACATAVARGLLGAGPDGAPDCALITERAQRLRALVEEQRA
jgi:2-dehydro-3-deoxyphosphogluconate aldolase/(4S)-4-hydroxy-2-oxoglutarate aldolase